MLKIHVKDYIMLGRKRAILSKGSAAFINWKYNEIRPNYDMNIILYPFSHVTSFMSAI